MHTVADVHGLQSRRETAQATCVPFGEGHGKFMHGPVEIVHVFAEVFGCTDRILVNGDIVRG
jgi:hypothetical protein